MADAVDNQPPQPQPRRVVGTREEVFTGLAERTKGGLRRFDLRITEDGRVVSIRRSELTKRLLEDKRLQALAKWKPGAIYVTPMGGIARRVLAPGSVSEATAAGAVDFSRPPSPSSSLAASEDLRPPEFEPDE